MTPKAPLSLAIGLVLSSATLISLHGQPFTNLAGNCRSVLFSVPSSLTLVKDGNGRVTEIRGRDRFGVTPGQAVVNADGTYTSTGLEVTSGKLAWTGQGLVTATSVSNAVGFRINQSMDTLMASGSGHEGYQDLNLILRGPTNMAPEDLTGSTWNMISLETPAVLVPQMDTNGLMYELDGRDSFSSRTGNMNIDGAGAITGNMGGPFTGTSSYAGNGQVNVSILPSEGGSFVLPFYINAGKNLMAGLTRMISAQDNSQELILLVRAPGPVVPADLQGLWRVGVFSTPASLQLTKDPQNYVRDVVGKDGFETGSDTVVAGHDGFFVANSTEPGTGLFTIGASGQVSVTATNLDGSQRSYAFKLNAAKDTLVAVRSDSTGNQLVVLTKAPVSQSQLQDFGMLAVVGESAIRLVWASGPSRELQASTNFVDWQSVPGTLGQHSYAPMNQNLRGAFYRVVQSGGN